METSRAQCRPDWLVGSQSAGEPEIGHGGWPDVLGVYHGIEGPPWPTDEAGMQALQVCRGIGARRSHPGEAGSVELPFMAAVATDCKA